MFSDLLKEKLEPLSVFTKSLPERLSGKPLHVATLHRWSRTGLKGIKLETVRIGGRVYTSSMALDRFFSRLTEDPMPLPKESKNKPNRRAEAALDSLGY